MHGRLSIHTLLCLCVVLVSVTSSSFAAPTFSPGDRVKLYSTGMSPSLSGLVGNETWLSAWYHHGVLSEIRYDAGVHNLAFLEHNGSPVSMSWQAFCLEAPLDWPFDPFTAGLVGPYYVTELQYSLSISYATPHDPGDLPFLGEDKAAQLTHMFDRYWGPGLAAVDAVAIQLAVWKVVHDERIRIIHGWPETPEWITRYQECYAYAVGFDATDGIVPGYAALDDYAWQNFVIRTSPFPLEEIPVPGVFGLSLVGLTGLGWLRRRRWL